MHLWAAIAVISVVTLASCAGNSGPKEDPPAAEWTDAQREAHRLLHGLGITPSFRLLSREGLDRRQHV